MGDCPLKRRLQTQESFSIIKFVFAVLALIWTPVAAQQISIGTNVQVSAARAESAHGEVRLAIDPSNPERMIAASMAASIEENEIYTIVYFSKDGGASWTPTLSTLQTHNAPLSDLSWLAADPSCAYGPDGAAYFGVLETAPRDAARLFIYRSGDGGINWNVPTEVPASLGTDRSYIIVDDHGEKYKGRVYVTAQTAYSTLGSTKRISDLTLYRSLDQGSHFNPPARLAPTESHSAFHPGNPVILNDGTVVSPVLEMRESLDQEGEAGEIRFDPSVPNSRLYVVKSDDGGDSLTNLAVISDVNVRWPPETISTSPSLAVDRKSSAFKNRLYATWPDTRAGRTEIFFSYSIDGGKSWAKAKTINDDYAFEAPQEGPDDFMPNIAVNDQGVVGLMWYDRRNMRDNLGWEVRFTASLDGGDTFLPSVLVSEKPMSHEREQWSLGGFASPGNEGTGDPFSLKLWLGMFSFNGGHTAGLEADSNGTFHPLWIDNRTGVKQVWTAPVLVQGEVSKNGAEDLASLTDVFARVALILTNMKYDRDTGIISTDAQLRNRSPDTIIGPIKLRALNLQSEIARRAEIIDADNRLSRSGAVWDFTSVLVNNQLKPGETSKRRKLTFRLWDLVKPRVIGVRPLRPIMLDARILATRIAPAVTPEKPRQ